MNDLVVILGSGASVELGIPSTNEITNHIANQELPVLAEIPFVPLQFQRLYASLLHELRKYYLTPNFEHILHAIESALSLRSAFHAREQDEARIQESLSHIAKAAEWVAKHDQSARREYLEDAVIEVKRASTPRGDRTVDRFRVLEGMLVGGPRSDLAWLFDHTGLLHARDEFFRILSALIIERQKDLESHPNWKSLSSFWTALAARFNLHFYTLNYDTCIEKTLSTATLGFEAVAGEKAWRFNPGLLDTRAPAVCHLHGCVNFGHRIGGHAKSMNKYIYEDMHEDLYWFESADDARSTLGNTSHEPSQAGHHIAVGPFITGLYKTEKVLGAEPYISYYSNVARDVRRIPRILVIGYGFTDLHLNSLLFHFTKWHGDRRRIGVIDFAAEHSWRPAELLAYEEHNKYQALAVWSKDGTLDQFREFDSVKDSKDKRVRSYWTGLNDVARNHTDGLLNFLET